MPAIWRLRRWPRGGAVAAALAVALVLGGALAGHPEPGWAAGSSYVKYYVVQSSYQGHPENLAEIAGRFLHSTARAADILTLNQGVVQSDGSKLVEAASLHAGWVLTLPWDAVGTGVVYGLPPTAKPAPPAPRRTSKPKAKPTTKPTPHRSGATCAGSPKLTGDDQAQWAMLRLAPQHAWAYTRGAGVLVAVLDSGADATVAPLAGHVATGMDIASGSGRGDTDCVGTGTAMAGIVVGAAADTTTPIGMAPAATVLPVRVSSTGTAVSVADQVSAVQVAVSAGAKVIALGQYIDPTKPAVAAAVAAAVSHDVVVIGTAPVPAATAGDEGGLLRVGAITIGGTMATHYRPGSVDVVAPGADVASLGISGTGQVQRTGTSYAVAFVAGEAALVRAMYPNLDAAQVTRRIEATTDPLGSAAPNDTYGWGLIDPSTAVTRVIPDENRGPAVAPRPDVAPSPWSAQRIWALTIAVLVALILIVLLVLRIRQMVRVATPLPAPALPATQEEPAGAGKPAAEAAEPACGEPDPSPSPYALVHAGADSAPARYETSAGEATAPATHRPAAARAGATRRSRAVQPEPSAAPTGADELADPPAGTGWWRHGPTGG